MLEAYAAAIRTTYPQDNDTPAPLGGWQSLREGIARLKEAAMREAPTLGADLIEQYMEMPMSKALRDGLVKGAPAAYKHVVLTLFLGSMDVSLAEMAKCMKDLAGLGVWGAQRRDDRQREGDVTPRSSRQQGERGQPSGPSRCELWRLLLEAGMKSEQIDGLPTGQLHCMCQQKGLLGGKETQQVRRVEFGHTCQCTHGFPAPNTPPVLVLKPQRAVEGLMNHGVIV